MFNEGEELSHNQTENIEKYEQASFVVQPKIFSVEISRVTPLRIDRYCEKKEKEVETDKNIIAEENGKS